MWNQRPARHFFKWGKIKIKSPGARSGKAKDGAKCLRSPATDTIHLHQPRLMIRCAVVQQLDASHPGVRSDHLEGGTGSLQTVHTPCSDALSLYTWLLENDTLYVATMVSNSFLAERFCRAIRGEVSPLGTLALFCFSYRLEKHTSMFRRSPVTILSRYLKSQLP